MPDLHFVAFGQCFPALPVSASRRTRSVLLPGHEQKLERVDNISNRALRAFRVRYEDNTITKDEIFDYIYSVCSTLPSTASASANDLSKELPRAFPTHLISAPSPQLGR